MSSDIALSAQTAYLFIMGEIIKIELHNNCWSKPAIEGHPSLMTFHSLESYSNLQEHFSTTPYGEKFDTISVGLFLITCH